jgi:tetratricopeptide (TPR) repeat protein
VLNLMVDALATARILLLVNYRPEYQHQWGSKTYYTQLRLDPLAKEGAQEMLDALLASAPSLSDRSVLPLPDQEEDRGEGIAALKRLIVERTEGNPFFMEEIVQALVEQGALVSNGGVKLGRPLDEIRVPPTVRAILTSRIDRLPAPEKQLLQTLAVLGREFSAGLIRRVAGNPDEEFERMVSALQLGEFIYEQPASGDVEYIFKHALTQEVAYHSVLSDRRRILHERAAEAIEGLFPERLDDHLAELAHHYNRSGNARKAAHYMARAGHRAAQQSAYEAAPYLTGALELVKQLPAGVDRDRQELDLQMTLGWLLYVVDPRSTLRETHLLRARDLCEKLDDNTRLKEVLLTHGHLLFLRGEMDRAQQLAEHVIVLAEKTERSPMLAAAAHSLLGMSWFGAGQYAAARGHLERALELFGLGPVRSFIEGYYEQLAAGILSAVLLTLGYPSKAMAKERESIAAVRRRADPFSLYASLYMVAMNRVLLRDSRSAAENAQEMLSVCAEHGSRVPEDAHFFHAWALSSSGGQAAQGITAMRRALAASTLHESPRALLMGTIAEACGRQGLLEEGLETVDDALRLDQVSNRGELHRIRGELLPMRGPSEPQEAERCLRAAIEIARGQSARLFELRATTSLARLLKRQGQIEEARAMLSEIYNWFTEGFEFADLKDAKALLDDSGQSKCAAANAEQTTARGAAFAPNAAARSTRNARDVARRMNRARNFAVSAAPLWPLVVVQHRQSKQQRPALAKLHPESASPPSRQPAKLPKASARRSPRCSPT